jgi:hypothetical protein
MSKTLKSKLMDTKLVSIKEILTKGWDIFSKNYQQFITPILIMLAPTVLYYLAMLYTGAGSILLNLVLLAAMIFVNIWISVILVLMADKLFKGQPIEINKIFEVSFAKIPSYLLVAILTGLAIFGGFILLIIPGIIFTIWFGFSSYINLLEDKDNKGVAALKSSKALVEGRWLNVFVRLVVPSLVVYIALIIVMIIVGIIMALLSGAISQYESMIITNIISSVCSLILTPLMVIFGIILYNSLKATKGASAVQPTQPTPPTPPAQQ